MKFEFCIESPLCVTIHLFWYNLHTVNGTRYLYWGVMVERVTVKREGEIEFSFIDGSMVRVWKFRCGNWGGFCGGCSFFWKLDLFTMEELRKHWINQCFLKPSGRMRRKSHWKALRAAIFAQGNALLSVSLNNKITLSGDALWMGLMYTILVKQ